MQNWFNSYLLISRHSMLCVVCYVISSHWQAGAATHTRFFSCDPNSVGAAQIELKWQVTHTRQQCDGEIDSSTDDVDSIWHEDFTSYTTACLQFI